MMRISAIGIVALAVNLIYRTEGIISGRLAVKGQFPFAVKIVSYGFERFMVNNISRAQRYICTGSILHEEYVLTTASCFQRLFPTKHEHTIQAVILDKYSPTYIRAGVFDGWTSQEPGFQERRGSKVIIHPDYVRRTTMFDVDVALIKVNKPWSFTQDPSQVSRAPPFAKKMKSDDFLKCSIAGFGYMSREDFYINRDDPVTIPEPIYGNVLRYYYGRVGRERYCKYLRRQMDDRFEQYDDFFACALPMNRTVRQGPCFGDEGGPMICYGLLTGVYSQHRAKIPCDSTAVRNTAFAVLISIGADEVMKFLREFVPGLPELQELPPSNPWDDYYDP